MYIVDEVIDELDELSLKIKKMEFCLVSYEKYIPSDQTYTYTYSQMHKLNPKIRHCLE
jgi:hypothetical protein